MKDKSKFIDGMEKANKVAHSIGVIITWVGFGIFVIGGALIDFPKGLFYGLLIGLFWLLVSFWKIRWAQNESEKSLANLKELVEGRPVNILRQKMYSVFALASIGILTMGLIFTCFVYSCSNDSYRLRLLIPLLAAAVGIEFLFRRELVKGKLALSLAIILAIVILFTVGKAFNLY